MTNPRLREKAGAGLLLPEDRGIDQSWLVAPFTYPDPEPSLYSDGSYGVCVLAQSLHSALLIAIRRREEFLKRTREPPTRLVMRVIKSPIRTRLHDLTQSREMEVGLCARELVQQLRRAKSYGFLLVGPKGGKDRLAIILRPTAFVPPAVQTEHYCFMWNGERIHKIFEFHGSEVIDPKDLARPNSRSAA